MPTQAIDESILREIVHRVVEGFSPHKVILFGSAAAGAAGPDSDVDLLVVMPLAGSRRRTATEIDRALVGIPVPVDVVVVTPEELEEGRHQIGTIARPALREGRVMVERAA